MATITGALKSQKKIGILGLGSIGSRHLKNFKELGCEVLGYDPNATNIDGIWNDTRQRQKVIDWADAIVIATPTDQHARDIIDVDCAAKPMFVEKPVKHAITYSVPLHFVKMVGYNLRFHSCVKQAKAWMGKGSIGKPLWANFTCAQYNDKDAYLRDGVILNWSHEIDLALHLIGPAVLLASAADPTETIADLTLWHEGTNCQTTVHLDYVTRWERRDFIIVGDSGCIEADLVNRQMWMRDNRGAIVETFTGRDNFDLNYLAEAQAFLDRLDGEDVPGCTATEAMNVVQLCLEAKALP